MKKRNQFWKVFAAAAVIVTGTWTASGSAQAQEGAEWEICHLADSDGIYLQECVSGIARGENGVSAGTGIQVYLYKDVLSFSLFAEDVQGPITLNPDNNGNYSLNAQVTLEDMGISRQVSILYSPDTKVYFFSGNDTVDGVTRNGKPLTINDAVLLEMYQAGSVDLTLSYAGWAGDLSGIPTVVYFTLPQYSGNFRQTYETAADLGWRDTAWTSYAPEEAPAVQEVETAPAYTNKQIEDVCNRYISTFRIAYPYVTSIYDNIMEGSYGWAFADGIFAPEPVSNFLEAKSASDNIVFEDLTSQQQAFYAEHKAMIDSTTIGMIMTVAEYVLG